MVEEVDIAQPAAVTLLDRVPMRDEDGEIRHEFVAEIARAIQEADTTLLRAIVGELHEADLGDLIDIPPPFGEEEAKSELAQLRLIEMRDMIVQHASTQQLRAESKRRGMRTLRQSGLLAIFDGVTSIEEVVKETLTEDV